MGLHSVTCHLTQINASYHNPSHTGRYSIYLPWRDGRLSWPWCWLYTEMVYLYTDSHPLCTNHLIATRPDITLRCHYCDPDHHQNLTASPLGHTQAISKNESKSVHITYFRNLLDEQAYKQNIISFYGKRKQTLIWTDMTRSSNSW